MKDESNSYIKLFRSFLSWEWYEDLNTKAVFIHLLLIASWKENKWRGIDLKPGDLIRTNENIAKELNMSPRNVRTAISRLITTGEVTVKKEGKYRVITLKNWGRFQRSDSEVTAKQSPKRQRSDSEVTAYKENKEIKNSKKYIPPTKQDIDDYVFLRHFKNVDVDAFMDYNESLGWKMEWHKALDQWVENQKKRDDNMRSKNPFLNIKQRDYDFEAMERMMEDEDYDGDLEKYADDY